MKYLLIQEKDTPPNKFALAINSLLACILLTSILVFTFSQIEYSYDWQSVLTYKNTFIKGFLMTLALSIVSLFTSLVLGVILALCQRSRVYIIKIIAKTFVEIIRGTPLMVQVLIFFYVVATAFGLEDRFINGIIILSIFSGAYLAEIIRGGIESVGKSNFDIAKVIGLSKYQTYRHVVFPQVLRAVLPAIAGQLVSLIKDSSLLSIIAIRELTMAAREMDSSTFLSFEAYLPLAIGYLIITMPVSFLSKQLEKRFQYES